MASPPSVVSLNKGGCEKFLFHLLGCPTKLGSMVRINGI